METTGLKSTAGLKPARSALLGLRFGVILWMAAGLPLAALAARPAAAALAEAATVTDLIALSVAELADLEITSVSRTPESLRLASRSVYVLTSEEIIRSGVATVPQALRLAPSLQVAAVSAHSFAITSRGMNIPAPPPPTNFSS